MPLFYRISVHAPTPRICLNAGCAKLIAPWRLNVGWAIIACRMFDKRGVSLMGAGGFRHNGLTRDVANTPFALAQEVLALRESQENESAVHYTIITSVGRS